TTSIVSGPPSLRRFSCRAAHGWQNGTWIRRLAGISTPVSGPVRKQSGHKPGNSYDFLGAVTALQGAMRAIITSASSESGPCVVRDVGDWQQIAISLIDTEKSEAKAHTCANAFHE